MLRASETRRLSCIEQNIDSSNSSFKIPISSLPFKNVEMFLSEWSLNMRIITYPKFKKVIIMVNGTLLGDDKVTVLKKNHNAGVLKFRKEDNLVKTTKGIYRLIGTIIGGSPIKLYETCFALSGVPKDWKKLSNSFLKLKAPSLSTLNPLFFINNKRYSQPETLHFDDILEKNQNTDKELLLKNVEMFLSEWSLNMRIITYPKFKKVIIMVNGTLLGDDKVTVLKKNHDAGVLRFRKEDNLVKTTKGIYRLIGTIIGGSPIKLYETCFALSGVPKNWKKLSNSFLKPKSPSPSPLKPLFIVNNKRMSNNSPKGSVNSTKQSNVKTVNYSKVFNSINNSSSYSQSKKTENQFYSIATSTALLRSFDLSKNKPFQKLSATTSKNSLNKSEKSKLKKNMINNVSTLENKLSLKKNNQEMEAVNILPSLKKVLVAVKIVSKESASQKKRKQCLSSVDLFSSIDVSNNNDVDFIMASPSKLSPLPCSVCSSSETSHFLTPQGFTPKQLTYSNPPSPINRSIEAKALKRVKAPKITLKEELKMEKINKNMKKGNDFNTTMKKFNRMLEYDDTNDDN